MFLKAVKTTFLKSILNLEFFQSRCNIMAGGVVTGISLPDKRATKAYILACKTCGLTSQNHTFRKAKRHVCVTLCQ